MKLMISSWRTFSMRVIGYMMSIKIKMISTRKSWRLTTLKALISGTLQKFYSVKRKHGDTAIKGKIIKIATILTSSATCGVSESLPTFCVLEVIHLKILSMKKRRISRCIRWKPKRLKKFNFGKEKCLEIFKNRKI